MRVSLAVLCVVVAAIVPSVAPADAAELIFNTQEFAPFNYGAEGMVGGPAADVIRKICADTRLACTMRVLPWRRAQQEVEEVVEQFNNAFRALHRQGVIQEILGRYKMDAAALE